MKIVKVTNLITSEYYYQRVEDVDSRRDPDGLFKLTIDNGSSKDMLAIDTTIVARNLSPELAVTKLIEFRIKASKDELHRTPRKTVDALEQPLTEFTPSWMTHKVGPIGYQGNPGLTGSAPVQQVHGLDGDQGNIGLPIDEIQPEQLEKPNKKNYTKNKKEENAPTEDN